MKRSLLRLHLSPSKQRWGRHQRIVREVLPLASVRLLYSETSKSAPSLERNAERRNQKRAVKMISEGRVSGHILSLGSSQAVVDFLRQMRTEHGLRPDSFTLSSALKRLADLRDFENCWHLFDSMRRKNPSLLTASHYATMITACTKQPAKDETQARANLETAQSLFTEMSQKYGLSSHSYAVCAILAAISRVPNGDPSLLQWAQDIFDEWLQTGRCDSSALPVWNSVLNVYCKQNRLDKALSIFEKMSARSGANARPNAVTICTLIGGCNGREHVATAVALANNYSAAVLRGEIRNVEFQVLGALLNAWAKAGCFVPILRLTDLLQQCLESERFVEDIAKNCEAPTLDTKTLRRVLLEANSREVSSTKLVEFDNWQHTAANFFLESVLKANSGELKWFAEHCPIWKAVRVLVCNSVVSVKNTKTYFTGVLLHKLIDAFAEALEKEETDAWLAPESFADLKTVFQHLFDTCRIPFHEALEKSLDKMQSALLKRYTDECGEDIPDLSWIHELKQRRRAKKERLAKLQRSGGVHRANGSQKYKRQSEWQTEKSIKRKLHET